MAIMYGSNGLIREPLLELREVVCSLVGDVEAMVLSVNKVDADHNVSLSWLNLV